MCLIQLRLLKLPNCIVGAFRAALRRPNCIDLAPNYRHPLLQRLLASLRPLDPSIIIFEEKLDLGKDLYKSAQTHIGTVLRGLQIVNLEQHLQNLSINHLLVLI